MPPQLTRYRAKRDFSRTPEPSGQTRVRLSGQARFVIQKHAARRLHYDLRLELDGVFKSWAVTRGPSLDPAQKRLAVEVEDHPLDYGDFEGTIPHGEYGGGTVLLWDRGFWRPQGSRSATEQLASGELKFELAGERLHGSWVLVRMQRDRSGNRRTNWLLIKHRDSSARVGAAVEVLEADHSVASGRTMADIAAGRGRGPRPFMLAGRKVAPANAVWHADAGNGSSRTDAPASPRKASRPAALRSEVSARQGAGVQVPDFIDPQLCRLVARPPEGADWVHEVKFDGYRAQLRVQQGRTTLKTRKGLDWTERFNAIARSAQELPDCLIDGEVVVLDEQGVSSFSGLQAALSAGADELLVYYAFDLLFVAGLDLRRQPLLERKQRLRQLLDPRGRSEQSNIRYVEHLRASGDTVLRSACEVGLEGIISKRLDSPYRSTRTDDWAKAKCRAGQEVVIGGWSTTQGNFRSLLAGMYREGRLAYVGRVGTGYGRTQLRTLLPRLKAVASRASPFEGPGAPRAEPNIHWVKPTLVAEIEFAGWTGDGNVRQAAFKGLREDKTAAEITPQAPAMLQTTAAVQSRIAPAAAKRVPPRRAPRKSAIGRPAATARGPARLLATSHAARAVANDSSARAGLAAVMGVTISHPGKALWPDAGDALPVDKLALARFYESVGEWLLPHLRGRPCSIVRAPDGIGGQRFFQRHAMPGTSPFLQLVRVAGDRKPYLQIDRIEGLIAVAQVAALELHPWNCQPEEPEVPGRLVFDLDPAPDVGFDAVIAAALQLRQRLTKLGLESFCKTTGGKGLHLVAPLASEKKSCRPDWKMGKAFAQAVCMHMANDSPDRFVINMAKRVRGGKIFLDYLRNDRIATAVAPLSPRARPGAPVSMPLHWKAVEKGLRPADFTVRTAAALLAKSRAWSDYGRDAGSLHEAVRKLVRSAVKGSGLR